MPTLHRRDFLRTMAVQTPIENWFFRNVVDERRLE